jgi:hypothetical protein
MGSPKPDRVAGQRGLGRFVARYPGTWFAHIMVAVLLAAFTGVIGFLGEIRAYQIGGSLAVVALVVWSVLIAKNKGFLLYEHGLLQVDALGRTRAAATWRDVVYVDGVRVNVTNGATSVERRDFTIVLLGGSVKFNDLLVRGGADFASRVAHLSASAGDR